MLTPTRLRQAAQGVESIRIPSMFAGPGRFAVYLDEKLSGGFLPGDILIFAPITQLRPERMMLVRVSEEELIEIAKVERFGVPASRYKLRSLRSHELIEGDVEGVLIARLRNYEMLSGIAEWDESGLIWQNDEENRNL